MSSEVDTSSTPDLVGWASGPATRGTLALVWSCVITIFACTWTVLHLNVPARNDGSLTILLRKIKWMTVNVLFPEFIFAKAVFDLRLALEELRAFDENIHNNEGILLRKWNSPYSHTTHEWSWEFEYPLWAHALYRLLHLVPPKKDVKQKQPPPWVSKLLSMLHAKAKSQSPSDIEAQTSLNSDELPRSNSQAFSPNSEVTSVRHDLDATSSTGHKWRTVQKWTLVHSYYAQMGGLLYHDETRGELSSPRYYSCTASMLTPRYQFSNEDLFDHLILGEQDIKDKSKADWVLKGIAIAQVLWLILSVVVRKVMVLPVTQLEIATISFAVMAILSYAANWWKPKDVSHATILQRPVEGYTTNSDLRQAYAQSFMLCLQSPKKAGEEARNINDQLHRVPNDLVWMDNDSPMLFILMAISSLGFGGLHCLAWNFRFPSESELLLWRTASVVSAALPSITLGISFAINFLATSYIDFKMTSILLRNLDPLRGVPAEFWAHTKNPSWSQWSLEAQCFLVGNLTEPRDWENEQSNEITERYATSMPDTTLYEKFAMFGIHLTSFLTAWEEAQHVKPFAARTLRKTWFESGSRMEMQSIAEVVALWQEYEDFIKGKHNISAQNVPDPNYVAFVLRAYKETTGGLPRWEKLQKSCERASPILIIISGIIYAIARLVILILLFTCLRETPAGVYQVTPWLNFLPNFS